MRDWAKRVHPRIAPDSSASTESRRLFTTWSTSAPDLSWRPSVHFCERSVEPTQTAEPRAHGNLRHWKIGLVEHALRALHTHGLGDLNRACFEMSLEEPGQMARADAEPLGEGFDAIMIEGTIFDQAECALDRCAGSLPGW